MARRVTAKVTKRQLRTAEDTARALRLRVAGWAIRAIAAKIGRSIGWVSESIRKAIRDVPTEDAAQYRAVVLEREEALIRAHWRRRSTPESARIIQASDKIIAELLGLNLPPDVLAGQDDSANDAAGAAERLAGRIAGIAERIGPASAAGPNRPDGGGEGPP